MNHALGREPQKDNDLFFTCSLIDYIARKTKNTRRDVVNALGKERIDHFHMKESLADAEGFITKETAPIVLLGEGSTHFKEAVQAIKDIDYEGWIISETFYNRRNLNENGMDYVSSAKRDVETLKAAFGDY